MGEEGIGNAKRNFIGIIILHRGRWLPPFIVRGEEQICGLHWRSTDFNTLYLTVKDKETGGKKKYRYSGISFRNTETLNRVLEGYGFTKENTFAKVTLFITVSRTMEILDGKMEIKNRRCYWCYRTCNGVDIRSSSWRKSIVKGRTIYDMVSAVDALLYKTEKIHILS